MATGVKKEAKTKAVANIEKQAKAVWGQYYNEGVLDLVKQEGIPVMGITFFNNLPYINQTGLDRKVKDKKAELPEVKMSTWTEPVMLLPLQPRYNSICKVRAHVEFFDGKFFAEMLDKIIKTKQEITIELMDRLKKISTEYYSCEGSGSAFDINIALSTKGDFGMLKDAIAAKDMNTIKKIESRADWDVVEMTVETRALSRTKRQAVGTGFTSIMEMPRANVDARGQANREEEESKYDYSLIRLYLHDPRLSTEQKNIIEQGMGKGKHPDKILEWVRNAIQEKGCNQTLPASQVELPFAGCEHLIPKEVKGEVVEETVATIVDGKTGEPVGEIKEEKPPEEKPIKFEGSDEQSKKLNEIIKSSLLTEQEREDLKNMTMGGDISKAIEVGLQKLERRRELLAFFSEYATVLEPFPKIDADILFYMTELNINAQHRMIEIIEANLDKDKRLPEEGKFNAIIRKELKIGDKNEKQA